MQGHAFLSQHLGKRETKLCEFQGGIKVLGHPGIHAETLSKQMRTHSLFCILRSWDFKSISETQKKNQGFIFFIQLYGSQALNRGNFH